MSALIEFEDVCKYYRMGDTTVKAADHISMKIEKGQFVAIVGSNGSGKTSLLNIICGSIPIEGGDVLVLSKDIVAVGLSERTTVSGAETFARNLLQNSDFKKVLAFDIPETRAFMHLDTVFTMVDYDKFTIHPEIEGPLSVYEMTLDEHGELRFGAIKEELKDILALELKLPAVDLIRCGGGDLMAAQREQWNDGSNTLCIAPGRVITYERNYVTNDLLAKHGLDVLTVPSAELSRGRGGPRCMSCPVNRDDL